MRMTDAVQVHRVEAAQHGDSRARDELIAAYLPLLYNIVGRALKGHADVDDVVQETLLCVVRDLPGLRDPNSFRSWLVAIAVRQISFHRSRRRASAHRLVTVEDVDELPDRKAHFEETTILQLQLAGERRQIAEASQWLGTDERLLLALWWQENVGWLSRADIAGAMGLTVPHVGVRLQRMREQLDLCRTVAAALAAQPRCPRLDVSRWDGRHTPLWRKRIIRHIRSCSTCAGTVNGRVPIERLLMTITPLAVPAAITAGLLAKGLLAGQIAGTPGLVVAQAAASSAGGAQLSLAGKLAQLVTAHPLVGIVTGATLIAGAAAAYVTLPAPREAPVVVAAPTASAQVYLPSTSPSPALSISSATPSAAASVSGSPAAVAGTVALGPRSLESVALPSRYVTSTGTFAAVGEVTSSSGQQSKQDATFVVIDGLADTGCVTLRAADGRYLRHYELRLRLSADDSTALFREDATFCPHPGAVSGSVTLQAHNYPALVIRYRDGGLYTDVPDGSEAFFRESSFIVRSPWAK